MVLKFSIIITVRVLPIQLFIKQVSSVRGKRQRAGACAHRPEEGGNLGGGLHRQVEIVQRHPGLRRRLHVEIDSR